ncbi:MAG: 23S rRNA (adenine(2503)-C(2))-methyltransferase RlmN [Trueperaceae bacterium]|nr:23S rRNA (adenine(2503)-C(2))-methyltransferase RlmN [Trueperaceae bacterium]
MSDALKSSLTSLLDFSVPELPIATEKQTFQRQQLAQWLFKKGAQTFEEMTNLPKAWREELAARYRVNPFEKTQRFVSQDKSVRYLFTLPDGRQTEAVYMPYKDRKTVCLSSMVGCPAGCAFCATGALGFGRNLTQAEIIGQILAIAWHEGFAPTEIRNVVLMGMGEALLNYKNALSSIRTMIDADALDMSPRRITLSTVGLPKQIRKLADEGLSLVLALSLHAPDEETRKQIIPTAHAYPMEDIIEALKYWQEKLGRRISIEYTMLGGINDHLWQADLLVERLKGLLVHVNLIPFNSWQNSGFSSSSRERIREFETRLSKKSLPVSVRFSRGQDTGAACGQLSLTQA